MSEQPYCDECTDLMNDDFCKKLQDFIIFPKVFKCEYHPEEMKKQKAIK